MKIKLLISPDGVHWKDWTIGLKEIARVRWSDTNHPVSRAAYSITVGAKRTFVQIELEKQEVFTEFIGKLWKAVGARLLKEIMEGLRAWQRFLEAAIRKPSNHRIKRPVGIGAGMSASAETNTVL